MYTIKQKSICLKSTILLLTLLSFASCASAKVLISPVIVTENTTSFHPKYLFTDSNNVAYFECEKFVNNALNNYTIALINEMHHSLLICSKTKVTNQYDPAITDTIYTFANAKNKIQIYRSIQADYILTFNVTDSLFILTGDIMPGMTKDLFLHHFQLTETTNNNILIANSEGSVKFMFHFRNNRLKRINTFLYLE
jgi:hypothetical protein